MDLFGMTHKGNPFMKYSKLCSNGTMLFTSEVEVHFTHVQQLLVSLCAFGRYIHINTGTHGRPDGSTVFFLTEETAKDLKTNKKLQKEWVDGA